MVPDKAPFQRTIFPAATARHGELDGTTTGEANRRRAARVLPETSRYAAFCGRSSQSLALSAVS
jgi:hypothetical protein